MAAQGADEVWLFRPLSLPGQPLYAGPSATVTFCLPVSYSRECPRFMKHRGIVRPGSVQVYLYLYYLD
jgi:hypothetical protein